MEGVGAETLLDLLTTYRVALAELRAMGDPHVQGLIDRIARRQAEAVAALALAR